MTAAPAHATPLDFSLFGGGPWARAEARLGLNKRTSAGRPFASRIVVGLAIGWLPLALLSLLQGPPVFELFLAERHVHAVALFAIPALLAGELYTDGRIRIAAARPIQLQLLGREDEARYQSALALAARRRDSGTVQAVALLLAFGWSVLNYQLGLRPVLGASAGGPLTPAVAWYHAVTLPLFWLAMLIWLWRFIIWSELLFMLSRLSLRVVPTHADRTGGIRYLANAQASFAPAVFALGCVLTAITEFDPSKSITSGLLNYSRSHVTYAATCLLVLNLPLASFAPRLLKAKRESDARFSELVALHGRRFQERWYADPKPEPLGQQDFSSMIDLSSSYEMATRMRWFPYGVRPALAISLAAVGSLVPRLLLQHQFLDAATNLMPKLF